MQLILINSHCYIWSRIVFPKLYAQMIPNAVATTVCITNQVAFAEHNSIHNSNSIVINKVYFFNYFEKIDLFIHF